ncbi:hypothetical protein [Streptomyces canus]|uniref:hypothetical protein n=1 Tax=Streptomyces canus TaxID=58343 RepID=UPI003F4B83EC
MPGVGGGQGTAYAGQQQGGVHRRVVGGALPVAVGVEAGPLDGVEEGVGQGGAGVGEGTAGRCGGHGP